MRAAIGITPCLDDRGRWRTGRDYVYADLAYVRAVEAAGGIPILLPPQSDPAAALERVDAILLPGGDDFLPSTPYPDDVAFDPTPPAQLDFDGRLIAAAEDRGLPILGICYGMQRLAIAHGGSLHYHLPSDVPNALEHKKADGEARHEIQVDAASTLATALGSVPESVNSLHHQAVLDPGPGLRVCARAPDGVIEAIEAPGAFCVGVQWHPERSPDAASTALFRHFIEAAEKRRAAR